MEIKIKKLRETATIPTRGSSQAAGYDLYADLEEPVVIKPHSCVRIGTGLAVDIPDGYFGAVFARTDLSYSSKKLVPVRAVPQIYTFGNRSDIPFSDYDRAVKRLRRGRKFRRLKSKAAEAIRKKFGLQQKA